jgi:hypothetical protein
LSKLGASRARDPACRAKVKEFLDVWFASLDFSRGNTEGQRFNLAVKEHLRISSLSRIEHVVIATCSMRERGIKGSRICGRVETLPFRTGAKLARSLG